MFSGSKLGFGAQCAVAIAMTIVAAQVFRAAIGCISYGGWPESLIIPGAPGIGIAVVWFVFVLFCLVFEDRSTHLIPVESDVSKDSVRPGARIWLRSTAAAGITAVALAITAWIILYANDDLLQSRSPAWIRPLVWLQHPGFRAASKLFPCQFEGGSDAGCEVYKTLPVLVLSNAVYYFPFLLFGLLLYRCSARSQLVWASLWRAVIRSGTVLGSVALCLRLLFYPVALDLSSPAHGWDLARVEWIVLDTATGLTALILFLFAPFCGYHVFRAIRARKNIRSGLSDLTWLASFLVAAWVLGAPYLR